MEYFVSYYDYYQPEAYVPQSDTYIEKDSSVNEELDKLRLSATTSLLTRRDVLIVASVSCIYGLGDPQDYFDLVAQVKVGEIRNRSRLARQLVDMQYERNDMDLARAKFRIRGDTLELVPAYQEAAVRVQFFGDEVERIVQLDPLTGEVLADLPEVSIYPANHFVTSKEKVERAIEDIKVELAGQLAKLAGERQSTGGRPAGEPHPLRSGNASRDRVLLRRGELCAAFVAEAGGQRAVDPARLLP